MWGENIMEDETTYSKIRKTLMLVGAKVDDGGDSEANVDDYLEEENDSPQPEEYNDEESEDGTGEVNVVRRRKAELGIEHCPKTNSLSRVDVTCIFTLHIF